jgi:serine/threonine protein kinase
MDKKSTYGLKPEQLGRILSIGSEKAGSAQSECTTNRSNAPPSAEPHKQSQKDRFDAPAPHIENYEILGKLGEAGQGQVWSALQISTNRRVALKVPRTGIINSEKTLARFEREMELAAGLKHPNIASIYDSGIHQGIYYYAMELVEGLHLDEYVKQHHLSIRQILKLMHTICRAVQHAHQKGVIHRDLKPSNIIVSEDGQPYIVDFGLAKNLLDDQSLTISTNGETAGTPAYMSPEQAAGFMDKLDTRTDVYSLGVILFTLLTGESPHDLSGTRQQVMERIIHQDVRQPHKICPKIDKELELLLLKALDNNPDRRYASAGMLAQDIDNYLNGYPLQAVPPSSIYQVRKFMRKNRMLTTSIAVIAVVLIAGVVVSTSFAVRAERQTRISQAVSNFLRDNLLGSVDPFKGAQRGTSVESILDVASEQLEDKFESEPLIEASIRFTLGVTYNNLGKHEPAESNLKRAITLRSEIEGERDVETLLYMRELGWVYWHQGNFDQAESILKETVDGMHSIMSEVDPRLLEAISRLAWTYWNQGRFEEAERLQAQALETVQRKLGPEHPYAPNHMEGLALAYASQGRIEEAEEICRKALDISRRTQGEDYEETVNITLNYAHLCRDLGRNDEGERRD